MTEADAMSAAASRTTRAATTRDGFAVIWVAIKREPWIFAVSTLGSVLFGALTVADAWVLGWSTDNVVLPAFETGEVESSMLWAILALFVGVAILRAVGIVARRLGAGIMQYRMQAHSRRAVTRQYLALPMEWHQRHPTGELLSNANSDVEAAWGPIAPLPMAVGTVAMMVIAVVQMFVTDTVMALVGLLVFPAVVLANLAYQRLASPLMTKAQELRAEVSEIAHESFDGAMVVKTLGREGEETARFAAKARELRDVNIRAGAIRAAFDPALAALPNLGVLVVLAVGVNRVHERSDRPGRRRDHRLPPHHRLLPDPLDRLAAGGVPAQRGRASSGSRGCSRRPARCRSARKPCRPGRPAPGSTSSTSATTTRRTRSSSRTSPSTVAPGRSVAVVGATASGKSTLTALLTRLVDPDRGRVLLDGVDLRELAQGELSLGGRAGAADRVPLRRRRAGQRHPGRRHPRRRGVGRAPRRPGRRLRGRAPAGPRRPAGRARHVALGRAAPADLAGPGPGPPPAAADPR